MPSFASIGVNVMVTILMVLTVLVLPWLDRTICRWLGVSLNDSISSNPNADRLLHLRKILLIIAFGLYLLGISYVTFFSRSAMEDYKIHVELYSALAKSISIDFGILGLIAAIFRDGLSAAMTHVRIESAEGISQVYQNICMFIPMGYLLPYIFDWFREKIRPRTLAACLLATLLIENVQLVTKHGYYDVDDLISNFLGGCLGMIFFMAVAYTLTNPDWRSELRDRRLWTREARNAALYPFFRKISFSRVTIMGSDRRDILDFYVIILGMYLKRTVEDSEGKQTRYLFEFGRNQLEIICSSEGGSLPQQQLNLSCNNSEYLKKRLESHGITTTEYQADIHTGKRIFSFSGPDDVRITIIEEE